MFDFNWKKVSEKERTFVFVNMQYSDEDADIVLHLGYLLRNEGIAQLQQICIDL